MIRNARSSSRAGSHPSGQYAIQFAELGGLRVLTTASPKNFRLVRGLGADEVFDYRDEGVVGKTRAATGNALDIAVDTVSERKTAEQVTGAIGNKGGSSQHPSLSESTSGCQSHLEQGSGLA